MLDLWQERKLERIWASKRARTWGRNNERARERGGSTNAEAFQASPTGPVPAQDTGPHDSRNRGSIRSEARSLRKLCEPRPTLRPLDRYYRWGKEARTPGASRQTGGTGTEVIELAGCAQTA